ncbi:MAG: GNAT family N-acetyltransferase [Chloroflexota bacterium]
MQISYQRQEIQGQGIKISAILNGKIVGRSYLYVLGNDLHQAPFGLVEDIFVEDEWRGQGIGFGLLDQIIIEAKNRHCYKLILTCRHSKEKLHRFYERLGFTNHGLEFRMDL